MINNIPEGDCRQFFIYSEVVVYLVVLLSRFLQENQATRVPSLPAKVTRSEPETKGAFRQLERPFCH
jgi:hypothetical protein